MRRAQTSPADLGHRNDLGARGARGEHISGADDVRQAVSYRGGRIDPRSETSRGLGIRRRPVTHTAPNW